jgi:hypothetical protein
MTFGELSDSVVLEKMRGFAVPAVTINDATLYDGIDKSDKPCATLPKESYVEVFEDYSLKWYLISDVVTGVSGWVKAEDLQILSFPELRDDKITKEELERYAVLMDFDSKTDFLVVVDTSRQKVHVFRRKKEKWTLVKSFPCSTGKNISPTIKGNYQMQERGEWFYSDRLGSGAQYWIRFRGAYLFHSRAMDKNKNVLPDGNEIGERVSNGCVRLYEDDAKWLYLNTPDKTAVFIN